MYCDLYYEWESASDWKIQYWCRKYWQFCGEMWPSIVSFKKIYRSLGNFCVKKYLCEMFASKIFVLYDNLTHVQLGNTYVKNVLCLIFVLFDEHENFLTAKISQIMVVCEP